MPTYDYECDSCSHSFEQFQSFSEDVLTDCPECGTASLRRLIGTGAAFICKTEKGWDSLGYREEDCPVVPHRGMSDRAYEKHCKDVIAANREMNRVAKRANENTMGNSEWKKIGMIPTELHQAEINRTGNKSVWNDEGDELLKATGTWVGD